MQKQKGKRINFKIVHCSSEDPEYPVTELIQQSPESKGWQNKRFSAYPEQIVIELIETSFINKAAFLSHQSKIASKIEIEMKVDANDEWKKIGRFSLDPNESTNFKARELRQTNINNVARFIKLVIRQNHVNNQNVFNQVGLISIAFYGFRKEELPPVQERAKGNNAEVDQGTLNRIRELEAEKKRAVEQENYDHAKNIKDEIDRLKRIASQITSLEERKQEAIKRENYEDAKIINEEIKRLRHGGQSQHESRETKPQQRPEQRKASEEEPMSSVSPITNARNNPNKPQPQQHQVQQRGKKEKTEAYEAPRRQQQQQQQQQPEDDDDRPINVKSSNPYQEPNEEQNDPSRESQLEGLSKQLFDECSQYFSVLDEEIFRHLFSKEHGNREKGVEMVGRELKTARNREEFIAACLYIVKNTIDDKVASVVVGVVGLLGEMLKKLKPQPSSHNQPLVDYILERMGEFLGHNNQKIRSISETTFSSFPIYHLTNKEACYRALASVGKREKPPKVLVGRLKMLNRLVREYQLGKDYEDVIKYAVKCADDKNNDVRVAAIALICSIAAEIGYNAIQPYLKNLRPPIIKSIEEKLEEAGHAEEPQNFDEKPLRAGKAGGKGRSQQGELEQGNEFIEVPQRGVKGGVGSEEQTCEFCKRVDKRFVEEDYKDMHYFNACPMLIICSECGQGIEISTLTAHLVGECGNSKYYKKCPRCKEAVHQKSYKTHVEKKECLPAKPMAAANRCPLCHLDISPGVNGWREHLVEQGCENNPRA